jgi:hypothetical protein
MNRRAAILGLFVALVTLYALVTPAVLHQHWDSLEYAFACEARVSKQVWGNHPLGHVVLCGAYRAAAALGYDGRALHLMSAVNAVVGAGSVVLLIALLGRLGIAPRRAAGWALVVAGLYGFWLYAATADIYAFSLLAQLVGWHALLWAAEAPTDRRAAIAGLAVGGAIVTHQFNGPLLVGACLGLAPFARAARRPAVRHAIVLALVSLAVVVAGYAALGVWSTGSTSSDVIREWIVGYGADPTYGRTFDASGLSTAMMTFRQTLLRSPTAPEWAAVRSILIGVMLVVAALGVIAAVRARATLRPAVISGCSQLAVGMPLVVWWAPYHIGKWWLLMLPALVVIQASFLETVADRVSTGSFGIRIVRWLDAGVFGLAAGSLLFTGLVTMRDMRTDPAFDRALASWSAHTRDRDVIIQHDVTAHLLFWTRRPNSLFLYRTLQAGKPGDPLAALRSVIGAAHADGRAVYYVPGTEDALRASDLALVGATRAELAAFFARYRRVGPVFTYRARQGEPEKAVFRLEPGAGGLKPAAYVASWRAGSSTRPPTWRHGGPGLQPGRLRGVMEGRVFRPGRLAAGSSPPPTWRRLKPAPPGTSRTPQPFPRPSARR